MRSYFNKLYDDRLRVCTHRIEKTFLKLIWILLLCPVDYNFLQHWYQHQSILSQDNSVEFSWNWFELEKAQQELRFVSRNKTPPRARGRSVQSGEWSLLWFVNCEWACVRQRIPTIEWVRHRSRVTVDMTVQFKLLGGKKWESFAWN